MKRVRITGIVKLANRVRQELAGIVSGDRLSQLRESVDASFQTINRVLAKAKVGIDVVPAPSRKAYQFLEGIDFESIATQESATSNGLLPSSVSFSGLRSYLDAILDDLASGIDESKLQQTQDSICESSENIEQQIRADDIRPEQLKPQSRAMRGWLAYFSEPAHLDAYLAALKLARPIFEETTKHSNQIHRPVLIHFRPMNGLFRIRVYTDLSRIQLPTGMICFDKGTLASLANLAFRNTRDRQPILDAMLCKPYQAILSEIDLLSGVIEHSAGIYHDIATAFDRVNATYFDGSLSSPRLTWSRTFTVRKFGHYDRMRDTVMVSSTLDQEDVPQYAVDFIVYHELLHKKLGVRWNNGRITAHTPEFLREEKRFRQYDQAKAVLQKLAGTKRLATTKKQQMSKKKPKSKNDALWAEAKRRCHLSADDIQMAKEMGLKPRSPIKNIPSKSQPWKVPVRVWIREMYEKRQEKACKKRARKAHGVNSA